MVDRVRASTSFAGRKDCDHVSFKATLQKEIWRESSNKDAQVEQKVNDSVLDFFDEYG